MDIFGAFQLCSIGILAAPVTVMVSRTLSNDRPIRNLIILWTLLILSGTTSSCSLRVPCHTDVADQRQLDYPRSPQSHRRILPN